MTPKFGRTIAVHLFYLENRA